MVWKWRTKKKNVRWTEELHQGKRRLWKDGITIFRKENIFSWKQLFFIYMKAMSINFSKKGFRLTKGKLPNSRARRGWVGLRRRESSLKGSLRKENPITLRWLGNCLAKGLHRWFLVFFIIIVVIILVQTFCDSFHLLCRQPLRSQQKNTDE